MNLKPTKGKYKKTKLLLAASWVSALLLSLFIPPTIGITIFAAVFIMTAAVLAIEVLKAFIKAIKESKA
ncbi:hypothetical protein [Pseudomonas baetica]|uniref:hypothetical protein n=1 Tax=Pseudomonas baetica TaxID=674054 RepID=UPI0011B2693F|nr:hypothetical protein [Pseudomonas baetica]